MYSIIFNKKIQKLKRKICNSKIKIIFKINKYNYNRFNNNYRCRNNYYKLQTRHNKIKIM